MEVVIGWGIPATEAGRLSMREIRAISDRRNRDRVDRLHDVRYLAAASLRCRPVDLFELEGDTPKEEEITITPERYREILKRYGRKVADS